GGASLPSAQLARQCSVQPPGAASRAPAHCSGAACACRATVADRAVPGIAGFSVFSGPRFAGRPAERDRAVYAVGAKVSVGDPVKFRTARGGAFVNGPRMNTDKTKTPKIVLWSYPCASVFIRGPFLTVSINKKSARSA